MHLATAHPEDVKSAIRKEYGTIKAFVEAKGLPKTGVSDVLRGRASRRVCEAIENVLSEAKADSTKLDSSSGRKSTHRLNRGAR